MNNIKKNSFIKVACLMLLVMMMITCVLSGTMAKYVSKGTGTVTAPVAKWEIKVNEEDATKTFTLADLEWTIYVEGTENPVDGLSGKIAPGTWGYAEIVIENAGDVDANITVSGLDGASNIESSGLSVKAVKMNSAPTSYTGATGDLPSGVKLAKSDTMKLYICFEWKFNDSKDDADTTIGTTKTEITFADSFTIKAEQVQPE